MCRCQYPTSHRDAWATIKEGFAWDLNARPLTWKEYANRVLDHYGKDSVTREEEHEYLHHILHPSSARILVDLYHELNRAARAGLPIVIKTEDGFNPQFHNDGGHVSPKADSGL